MQLTIFDTSEFAQINKLRKVTSPTLLSAGAVPDPEGLVSNDIFGVTTKLRKHTFAYIDLYSHYFNPHIYIALSRIFNNLPRVIAGTKYYRIDEETGYLIEDNENGETGLEFLYDNWEKINFRRDDNPQTTRNSRINVIKGYSKDEVFMSKQIVIPAFYRDVKTKSNGSGSTDDINKLYQKLIRESRLIRSSSMYAVQFHNTNLSIQLTIVNIYKYFRDKLKGKDGLIRKYLMGKNVDFCTRSVITAGNIHCNTIDDMEITYEYSSVPISQACTMAYPFIEKYLVDFFDREIISDNVAKMVYDAEKDELIENVKLKNPAAYFSEKYIKKMIDTYQKDPGSRFNTIDVPAEDGRKYYLVISGKRYDVSNKTELSPIVNRPMTWTDLLYLACESALRDKHILITRYPILDEFGTMITKIRISSTTETEPMIVDGVLYKYYPKIDFKIPKDDIGIYFIDSVRFSHSYLPGLDGDYDGDQTTCKIAFTQEANNELEEYIYKKENFINAAGDMIRKIENEALQTFYVLTKNPNTDIPLSKEAVDFFMNLKAEDYTFDNMVSWLGKFTSIEKSKVTAGAKLSPKYDIYSTFDLKYDGKTIHTTLGKFIYNKVMIQNIGLEKILGYINDELTEGAFGKLETKLTTALKDDLINTKDMIKYIDTRDWFGLSMHGVVTSSFTPGVIKTPKEVIQLKNQLFKKYEKEIAEGNTAIVDKIEKQLIAKEMEVLKGDVGLDLYTSGARGSVGNNLKNINLMRGSVYNNYTGKFDVVKNSLMDMLDVKDYVPHVGSIVAGSYARGVGTQEGGYLTKQLIQACSPEILGPKDSDCGSKGFITIKLTKENAKMYIYRYMITESGLVMLSNDNVDKYIGKEIKFRSPQYCIGLNKNQHCLCNKCMGDEFYILEKENIGLLVAKASSKVTKLSLAKFHDSVVKVNKINPDEILLD